MRVFREGASLLKVGVALMALALALVIAAVVVSVVLRSDSGEWVAAAKTAAMKPLDDLQRYSSGEKGSATNKSSGEKEGATRNSSSEQGEPSRYPYSGEEEPLGHGSSSSSGGPVGQREEEAKEPQAVAAASEPEPPESEAVTPQPVGQQTPSEAQSEPEPSEPESSELEPSELEPSEPEPPNTEPFESEPPDTEPFESEPSGPEPQPRQHQAPPEEVQSPPEEVQPSPEEVQSPPEEAQSPPEDQLLPGAEGSGWAEPTPQEIEEANSPRHYGGLVDGAIMALTIEEIGIYDAPVFDSTDYWALANGIGHHPETSLPWSTTPQRNVFLAGHRMGFTGTWSRMLFYNLDKLGVGDTVVLKDRAGQVYEYRVSEVFLAEPTDTWVMGQVSGRDMVTLQTCTPIPTFEQRLIVRADRV